MGNGTGKLSLCFAGDAGEISRRRHDIVLYLSNPLDEGLGHSFCYIRPDPFNASSRFHLDDATTTFKAISGASISANTSTPLSTDCGCPCNDVVEKASAFESSDSFAAIPLQPVPRDPVQSIQSGPIPRFSGSIWGSGPVERGFLSGPIERSFISGPFEPQFKRYRPKSKNWGLLSILKRAIAKSIVVPIRGSNSENHTVSDRNSNDSSFAANDEDGNGEDDKEEEEEEEEEDEPFEPRNVQWAQGKAGEDRVHVVVSEEHGWVFVGIYDGFNGPDATDFLANNLYSNIHKELKGLLWNDNLESVCTNSSDSSFPNDEFDQSQFRNENAAVEREEDWDSKRQRRKDYPKNGTNKAGITTKWEENQRRWKCQWDRERVELDRKLKEHSKKQHSGINHADVLRALSEALRKTEESYLGISDLMLRENPELSLMGSCVLAMLMRGEDVYLMNVGDSRAVVARKAQPDLRIGKGFKDLERINEETLNDLRAFDNDDELDCSSYLDSIQLTMDHSTSVKEEVRRIKSEHWEDPYAIKKDRVKGSLKVTRAFGAGFLKKPKWNNALLEMFRVDYVGTSPYINCLPSLHHHRLSPRDRFLILSSDGLYQYFTNEEAVSEVQMFIATFPEGDPAQHLVEEVLFRAAKKAGMDFHELLDIPQGERRRYHDDVSVIIISLEGSIWRSSV